MKQILLLAAIYSLIIHQSHKNAKEKITAGHKQIINAISSETNSYKKEIASPNFINVKTGYVSVSDKSSDNNLFAKWGNKE
jgi:hypothetical protein